MELVCAWKTECWSGFFWGTLAFLVSSLIHPTHLYPVDSCS
jgi:hypothetical protein